MAGSAMEQLAEHAGVLLQIRKRLFQQLEQEGRFRDVLVDKLSDEEKDRALAPLAFGLEGILMPVGMFSSVANLLKDVTGYSDLKLALKQRDELLPFSTDILKDRVADVSAFKDLFYKVFPKLADFSLQYDDSSGTLLPYASHDNLDLDCWILAALVDAIDLYFLGDEFLREVVDDPDAQEHHRKAVRVLNGSLTELQRILEFTNYPDELYRRGWYASLDLMEALNKTPTNPEERENLPKKLPTFFPQGISREEWKSFIGEVLSHRNIVETSLVTTRAVIAFTVVAESAYREQKGRFTSAQKGEMKDAVDKVLRYFDEGTGEIFRSEQFADFVIGEFERQTRGPDVETEDYDGFIHTLGILSFALTRGYFTVGDAIETFDPDDLRPELRERIQDRGKLIEKLLDYVGRGVKANLTSEQSWVDRPNHFLATKDWTLLFDESGEPVVRGPEEKESLGDDHTFPFILALPLVVKGLANLAFEERLRVMLREKPEEWGSIEWPSWLERLEETNADLATRMIRKQLTFGDDETCFGSSIDGEDLSVTAGVVDALSLWCTNLMLRAAVAGELAKPLKPPKPPVPEPPPGAEFTAGDMEVVGRFFQLLKHWTGQPGEARPPATRSSGLTEAEASWFKTFWMVLNTCFDYVGPGFDWTSQELTRGRVMPDFPEVLKVVGLIRFLHREVPQDQRKDLLPNVLTQLADLLAKTEGGSFSDVFATLLRDLRKEYAEIFDRGDSVIPIQTAKKS